MKIGRNFIAVVVYIITTATLWVLALSVIYYIAELIETI